MNLLFDCVVFAYLAINRIEKKIVMNMHDTTSTAAGKKAEQDRNLIDKFNIGFQRLSADG